MIISGKEISKKIKEQLKVEVEEIKNKVKKRLPYFIFGSLFFIN